MLEKTRIDHIMENLRRMMPDVKIPLTFNTPFELLVAAILSAQCTDRQVNRVTVGLFQQLISPADFAAAPQAVIEQLIRRAGLHRNKARYIKDCARLILERHDGRVPDTLKELVALPGVGRKTANVVLGAAFGIPAVAVDTHVARIAMRLGLTAHTDPVKIEVDLMEKIPKPEWNAFCLRLVYFGRQTCTARKPACPVCRLKGLCPYFHKTEASAGND